MSFSSRLKELRKQKGWNQKELSTKLHAGQSLIANYESGRRYPNSDKLIEIARLFDVSIDYLVGVSDNPGKLDESEVIRDPELTRIVELVRPTIDGVPVSDDQWKLLNIVLGGIIQIERDRQKKRT